MMTDREKQVEIAVKNPELVIETQDETIQRERAEQLYYNSGGRALSGVGGYEAGWKAAKAYYRNEAQ
jgi:hypothetical protein